MMKAYPEYKESGVTWVGKLPSHWNAMPLKYAVIVNREALTEQIEGDFELQYIDIGNVNESGIINPPEKMKFVDAPSRARRIIKKNDTIISTVRTYLKAVAFIENDDKNLIASTGFATLTSLAQTYPKYLYYLVSSQGFVDTVSANSTGVSYPAITSTELAQISAWLPPLPEQQAIADFLDRKTAQIDTLIEKKQRQIDLLHEQRTALINHAVTKGLNLNAPMKDSGVEWLGEIPSHWEVIRIKLIEGNSETAVQTGPFGAQLHASDYMDDGVPLILIKHVNNLRISNEDLPRISPEKAEQLSMYRLKKGDIVFSRVGSIGRIALVDEQQEGWLISGQMLRMRIRNPKVHHPFAIYAITGYSSQIYFDLTSVGSTRDSINTDILRNFPVPIPPLPEQQAIAEFLDRKTAQLDTLIEKIKYQIDLLHEQRTALISAAVTGKIDVRT